MNTSTHTQEVINFGKHKGTALVDLSHSYVHWLLSLETLNAGLRKSLEALDWLKEDLDRNRAFQKRKELAIALQKSHIPSHERKAHKRRMGWVGA